MGYISSVYRFFTNAGDGAAANIQSKVGGGGGYSFWRISDGVSASSVSDEGVVAVTGTNGTTTSLSSTTLEINGGSWALASGSLLRSTDAALVSELPQGTDNYVLTVAEELEGGMAWEEAQGGTLTNTYVGYGSASDVLTGESVFNYNTGVTPHELRVPELIISNTGSATTFTATTITDGTATMSGDIVTAGTITDGVATLTGDTLTAGTITDGTATLTGGDLSVADLTSAGAITHQTRTVTTVSPPATPVLERMSVSDYHLHIINIHDPGVTQDVKLPIASAGREVIITTDCELAPGAGGTKVVDLSVEGTNPLENINRTLTSTTLNSNGSENYSIYKFTVLEDGFTWAGAKMGYVT